MARRKKAKAMADHTASKRRRPQAAAAALLTILVLAVFSPILSFDFVGLDVGDQVINNPRVHGLSWENLRYIWTSKCVTSYYPIRTLTFAWDYEIWGLRPFGFKLTNLLIHLANAMLLFWLARRLLQHASPAENASGHGLSVWAAMIGAGLFATHPVVVEPVAWIGGREELLTALGALACLHFHLSAMADMERGRSRRAWACHLGAVLACASACLSNAAGAVIPAIIVIWDAMTLSGAKRWRLISGTAPLWIIAAATIAIKLTDPTVGSGDGLPAVLSAQWVMLVFQTYFHNVAALFWPTSLAIVYDWRVPSSFAEPAVLLGMLAAVLSAWTLWKVRRQTLLVVCLLWFAAALAPYAQLMPHHILRADRYLYVPLAMLACAAALILHSLLRNGKLVTWAMASGVVLLLVLGLMASGQVQTWRSRTALWAHAIRVAPHNPVALGAFADALAREGRFAEAIPYYERAIQRDPHATDTLNNYAIHLATWEDERLRDYERAIRLARRGCELSDWQDLQLRRTLAKAYVNYAKVFYMNNDYGKAIEYCRKAIEADPDYDGAPFNLALLLATCPDPNLRRPEEAVQWARCAMALTRQLGPLNWIILARAHRAASQWDAAAAAFDKAAELAESLGQTDLAEQLRSERAQLKRVRNE